jgi:hypothetical protein
VTGAPDYAPAAAFARGGGRVGLTRAVAPAPDYAPAATFAPGVGCGAGLARAPDFASFARACVPWIVGAVFAAALKPRAALKIKINMRCIPDIYDDIRSTSSRVCKGPQAASRVAR